jgi:hypothetical protein
MVKDNPMRALPRWLLRLAGMALIGLLGYFLLFGVLDRYDINWALPWKKMIRAHWPDLPFFSSWTRTTPEGGQETIYQVPSRVLTPQEIAQLKYTPPRTNAPTSSGR